MKLLGAIIAGGQGRRFGGDKGAAMLGGKALIDHVADALRPQVDALIVCGREWPGLDSVADRPAPDMGPLGGLNAALHAAQHEGFDMVLTTGCDVLPVPTFSRHPELVSGSMDKQQPTVLVEKWMLKQVQHDGSVVASVIKGQPLFGLWPTSLASQLDHHLATQTDRSMRHWIAITGAREVECATDFHNLNTREDFALYCASEGLAV
jgi:molybdenum cofactor guanylyltransferase